MNHPFFTVFYDSTGDLYMLAGLAFQPSTGEIYDLPYRGIPAAGTGSAADPAATPSPPSFGAGLRPAYTHNRGIMRAGGSGRNLILNSADGGPSEWAAIPRVFYPTANADEWEHGVWLIRKTSATTAELDDGTNIVAEMTTGTAPFGNFSATTAGEDDYNAGSAFTLAATQEAGVNHPTATLSSTSAGTFPTAGTYNSSDGITWTNDDDALLTIVVSLDGSADLFYDGVLMAERDAGGNPYSAGGLYVATTAGEDDYNAGDPWTASVIAPAIAPGVGFVYVMIHFTGGVLTAVRGPYHAVTLPAATSSLQPIPIARSDGSGNVEQYQTGMIIIP